MKNKKTGHFQKLYKVQKEHPFDILLCSGPSNLLEDRNLHFVCGKKLSMKTKKWTIQKLSLGIFVKLYYKKIRNIFY